MYMLLYVHVHTGAAHLCRVLVWFTFVECTISTDEYFQLSFVDNVYVRDQCKTRTVLKPSDGLEPARRL